MASGTPRLYPQRAVDASVWDRTLTLLSFPHPLHPLVCAYVSGNHTLRLAPLASSFSPGVEPSLACLAAKLDSKTLPRPILTNTRPILPNRTRTLNLTHSPPQSHSPPQMLTDRRIQRPKHDDDAALAAVRQRVLHPLPPLQPGPAPRRQLGYRALSASAFPSALHSSSLISHPSPSAHLPYSTPIHRSCA